MCLALRFLEIFLELFKQCLLEQFSFWVFLSKLWLALAVETASGSLDNKLPIVRYRPQAHSDRLLDLCVCVCVC